MTQIDELVKRARSVDEEKLNVEPWTCEQLIKGLADALEAQAARVKMQDEQLAQMHHNAERDIAELTRLRERNAELESDIVAVRDSFLDFCNVRQKEIDASNARIAALEAQLKAFREALTPSAETKAAYIGEFSFQVHDGYGDEGEDLYRKVAVPWTTVKEIMKAISARALMSALRNAEGEKDGE